MTLIVGIRCNNGVVIGSDSAMTFGASPQRPTIEQTLRKKIFVIENKLIVSGSGPIGHIQRFNDIVNECWKEKKLRCENPLEIGRELSKHAILDFRSTGAQFGKFTSLVAAPFKKNAELIEFYIDDFQPELKDKNNWYVSIGSGQNVADPLLGFVREAFWGDKPPSYQDGIFAATMVLELACKMVPIGVQGPIQMATLVRDSKKRGQLVARELSEHDLSEHKENVANALVYFRKYRDLLRGGDKPSSVLPTYT